MPRLAVLSCACLLAAATPVAAQARLASTFTHDAPDRCLAWREGTPRNPTAAELRCVFGIQGPGRFGLLWYLDVPSYQPATPLPGTHVVGVPGMPGPRRDESFEAWEWRVLRTEYGAEVRHVHRSLEVLDVTFAAVLRDLEGRLHAEGIRFGRRETWRSADRQAFIFQQGRSRPGPLATATLTSWHSTVDAYGRPAGRAADYDVPRASMERFHQLVADVGLESFGADSNDPGHVFLSRADDVDMMHVILLRLLPRVPVVTLATGRPIDESTTAAQRAEWREESWRFAREPFIGLPEPGVSITVPAPPPLREAVAPPAAATRAARR